MAEKKHTLHTRGAWVKVLPYEDLKAKHRNRAVAGRFGQLTFDPNTGKPRDLEARSFAINMLGAAEDIAAMLVTAWNIPYMPGAQLPADHPDLLGELRIEDYNKLLEITEPIRQQLIDPPKPVDPGEFDDADSPTGPASA